MACAGMYSLFWTSFAAVGTQAILQLGLLTSIGKPVVFDPSAAAQC